MSAIRSATGDDEARRTDEDRDVDYRQQQHPLADHPHDPQPLPARTMHRRPARSSTRSRPSRRNGDLAWRWLKDEPVEEEKPPKGGKVEKELLGDDEA